MEHFLQLLCSNDVAIPVGCSVRTLILNKRGGIELSCTVIREAQNRWASFFQPLLQEVRLKF